MIRPGDRVAVALSGGKDSLSLLRLLDWRRKHLQEDYELIAIHVQGDTRGPDTPAYPPLADWVNVNGYHYEILPPDLPAGEPLPLNCQRCSRNRRRVLFQAAERHGCNVVAYGHHADDLAQTTLLNLLFHGRVETMPPVRDYFDGRFRLIRPLYRVPEKELRRFARACGFPPPPQQCPRGQCSQRELARDLLRQVPGRFRNVRANLVRAGLQDRPD